MRADVIYQRLTEARDYLKAYNELMLAPSNQLRIAAVVESLTPVTTPVGRVLDVASGGGAYVTPAKTGTPALANAKYFAVDREAVCVGAYRMNHPEAPVALADATRLPFPPATFDLSFCLDIIEHIDDDQGFLNEVSRVIKPGGHVVVSTHNRRSLEHIAGLTTSAIRGRKWLGWDPTHIRFYDGATLQRMCDAAGFDVVAINGTYYVPFHLPARLVSWPLERLGAASLARAVHRVIQTPWLWFNALFERLSLLPPFHSLGWGIVVVARRRSS
jgi:2-polyprenyl-3-methyl-5-hydroxy-6-metoxy-1,4-benzoquinol methylase